MKNAWEDWTEYRSKLTEIILERNPKTVMIVGAGRCNDIDLERLLKSAERVICMDVDDEAMKAAVTGIPADIQHMVECREVSLTGIGESDLDSFCDDMLMMARAKGRDLTLDYFRAQMISCMNALKEKLIGSEEALLRYMPVESVDVVVCAGVHSQLFSTLSFFIRSLIASLYDIIPNVGSLEAEANDIIREMNNRVIPIIDSALCRMADKAVIFGNEDNPNNRISSNQINFQDPKLHKNYHPVNLKNKIDINKYRRSNWTISNGDERDFFKSSYGLTMTPKKPEIKTKKEINTYKSSVVIGAEDQKDGFVSEYRKNYPDGKLAFNLKNIGQDKKLMETINNIRKSHFNFGESKNDYFTTSSNAYKYDPVLAREGRGQLNDVLKNNLRSSHYELGMGNEREKYTSNRRDYISYPNYKPIKIVDKNNQSSAFHRNRNVFEGESIYMSDYTEKPIPNPDENLPDFL